MEMPQVRRMIALVMQLLSSLVLSGCFEAKNEYTVNPDGSGKVAFLQTLSDPSAMMGEGGGQGWSEEMLKETLAQLIGKSKGVEGWTDLSVKVLEDGFECDGRHFKSLSAVAREIAGTRWNGYTFFALTNNDRRNNKIAR